jgi:maltose alpha-D-glucosyltransferase/alpha-amylase
MDGITDETLWYKDALIYQLHVKAFCDSDESGTGDFAGLTSKLDYIQGLGVTAVWLLPFYPSPLKDDGYDIADYTAVHPAYGTMRDFGRFVNAAHRHGIRVITELVINHTSDAHPWFQRARRSPPSSVYRNYYVWSDTDKKYEGTRIIFRDTEKSNWAWDPTAGAYYWHRFFSHQPDLNYDNPRVLDEVLKIMRFWLDHGVDGLRLDAVPYLCEREDTNNENLPETHAIIRRIRAELDRTHPGRMLLAEANQWPEDVRPYFGEGDECHMAFHFPLMPRLYMAIAQEDRHPITDIMRQTPDIPENCQWAIFLRNHDELTLEMVTDRERDYLWNFYATDRQMRINLGIRRRLAPLVDGDRAKTHLLQSLLLSLPGTPVMYYGDEIGMGDNIYLGDRNGVRTPMQWTPDRNGGFSRADPARLYLPPIMDPVYGYEAINVEAQSRRPSSLLNWMRRIISVRKAHKAFSRGTIRFLRPGNRKVLMYLREYGDDLMLCVANLSRAPQPVEIRMPEQVGRVPVELLGRTAFPPIGESPYFLSLPGYGFYWFRLTTEAEAPRWHEPSVPVLPEFVTLVIPQGWPSLVDGPARRTLERTILPEFLARQRWCTHAHQAGDIQSVELMCAAEMPGPSLGWLIGTWRVRLKDDSERWFLLPLAIAWERGGEDALAPHMACALGRVRKAAQVGGLFDALYDESFARAVVQFIRDQREIPIGDGKTLRFRATSAMPGPPSTSEPEPVQRIAQEQVNTTLRIGRDKVFKAMRCLSKGRNPELEVNRFLTETARFPYSPRLFGWMEIDDAQAEPMVLGLLRESIINQGDGWTYAMEYLLRYLDQAIVPTEKPAPLPGSHAAFAHLMRRLGERTAFMHHAFMVDTDDPMFRPEPVTAKDVNLWSRRMSARLDEARQALDRVESETSDEPLRDDIQRVLGDWKPLVLAVQEATPKGLHALKTRYHGNFNLEQVLVARDDFYIIDFEGEPSPDEVERQAKALPLRDVATMLRSFHHLAWAAATKWSESHAEGMQDALTLALDWRHEVTAKYLAGYTEAIRGCASYPADKATADNVLTLFRLEKAVQEIPRLAATQPNLLHMPIQAILRLAATMHTSAAR